MYCPLISAYEPYMSYSEFEKGTKDGEANNFTSLDFDYCRTDIFVQRIHTMKQYSSEKLATNPLSHKINKSNNGRNKREIMQKETLPSGVGANQDAPIMTNFTLDTTYSIALQEIL